MVLKQEAYRGTRRLFQILVTDLNGNPQDPDSMVVIFRKVGEYSYDSPQGPFTCLKTGGTGYWGYWWNIPESITLGDWVADFQWLATPPGDGQMFFILKDYQRPYIHKPYLPAGSRVIG